MSFEDFLKISAGEIDSEIESFLVNYRKDVEHISLRLLPLFDGLAEACNGGKRIRGTLVKLSHEGTSFFAKGTRGVARREASEILKVAAAVEIFQTAILSHDDIIDKSLKRRGKPSLYARFGGDHEGISKAICLGDIGYFLAFKLIGEIDFPDEVKSRVIGIFSKMTLETTLGELLDFELTSHKGTSHFMASGKSDWDGSVGNQEVITVYKYKTAYYTITAPLVIGAVLGGAPEVQLKAINIFGHNLGIAFQIQDDINDIFSDSDKLGKDPGGDIKEGKQTLLSLYARENADEEQKEILEKYFGNSEIGEVEVGKVAQVFESSGALGYAREQAEEYAERARGAIAGISEDEGYREMFLEMTEYFLKA